MSTTEHTVVDTARLPSFELEYGFDDGIDPSTVTVYDPDAEDVSTTWLTIDAGHSVSLEDVA